MDTDIVQVEAAHVGRARFVLLTTFRASGVPVATAVWIVVDGDHLAVLTNADTGKVRRLTRNASVVIVPCNARGEASLEATPVRGRAAVLADDDAVAHVWKLVRRKYPVEYFILRFLGRIKPAWNRWDGPQVALRITPDRCSNDRDPRG